MMSSDNDFPRFSIVIPSYNRSQLIIETLRSVAAQNYKQWECIVVDDLSTDNTIEVVKDFSNHHPSFKVTSNVGKKGAQGARNTGLHLAQFEWVVFFDSDDIMSPEYLTKMAEAIQSNDADVYCCHLYVRYRTTNELKFMASQSPKGCITSQLLANKTYVYFSSSIVHKNRLIQIGGLDEDCPSFQEWETHIRLSQHCAYHTVEEPLVTYFVGGEDAMSANTRRTFKGYLYLFKKFRVLWSQHLTDFQSIGMFVYDLVSQKKESKVYKTQITLALIFTIPGLWKQIAKKKFLS
ncbi:MAG: glycosyltransferase family 2 protein [Flavobacteriales bacterium]